MFRAVIIASLALFLLVAGEVAAASSSPAQIGCGVFIPQSDVNAAFELLLKNPSTTTNATVKAALNSHCSNWQCGRAIPFTTTSSKETQQQSQFVCVQGVLLGGECLTDSDCFHGLACDSAKNYTCQKKVASSSASVVGFLAVLSACFFWGSNFLPARTANTGNGILFQLYMSSGILFVGFAIQVAHSRDNESAFAFYPNACVGGVLWSLGNSLCLPVLSLIGFIGVAIWGCGNCLVGWASSFGFWGLAPASLAHTWATFVGVFFGVISLVLLALVKPTRYKEEDNNSNLEDGDEANQHEQLLGGQDNSKNANADSSYGTAAVNTDKQKDETTKKASADQEVPPIVELVGGHTRARYLGLAGACMAGALFGLNNLPVQRLDDNYERLSQRNIVKPADNDVDYAFSHFTGIFVTSLLLATLESCYSTAQRRWPTSFVGRIPQLFSAPDPDLLIPGLLCGLGWGIAQASSFLGNSELSMSVSYPLCTIGPGLVASAWSVFLFKEIRGLRNYVLLSVSFVAAGISAGLVVYSRG